MLLSLADYESQAARSLAPDVAAFLAEGAGGSTAVRRNLEAFQRILASGLTYNGRVGVSAAARHVKVVVYDYGADLIGSAMVQIK